jgi:hypothetical protein
MIVAMDAIPLLSTRVAGMGIRLELGHWTYGNGRTVEEAADDLVERLTAQAAAVRRGIRFHPEAPVPDLDYLDFLWELGEPPVDQDRIRARIFGAGHLPSD